MLQDTVRVKIRKDIHFPYWLRHKAFFVLVSWMMSRTSPRITDRSFAPGFFIMPLGSTIMVCSALREPSYCGLKKPHELLKKSLNGGQWILCEYYYFMSCMWHCFTLNFFLSSLAILGSVLKKNEEKTQWFTNVATSLKSLWDMSIRNNIVEF